MLKGILYYDWANDSPRSKISIMGHMEPIRAVYRFIIKFKKYAHLLRVVKCKSLNNKHKLHNIQTIIDIAVLSFKVKVQAK